MKKLLISSLSILTAALTYGVTLQWDQNPETDIVQYKIYWSTNVTPPYTNSVVVNYPTTNITIVNTNFVANKTYYFAATAINSVGLESGYSNIVPWTNLIAPSAVKNVRVTLSIP